MSVTLMAGEEGEVKCFRRTKPGTDENEQPHLWSTQSSVTVIVVDQARYYRPQRFVNHL